MHTDEIYVEKELMRFSAISCKCLIYSRADPNRLDSKFLWNVTAGQGTTGHPYGNHFRRGNKGPVRASGADPAHLKSTVFVKRATNILDHRYLLACHPTRPNSIILTTKLQATLANEGAMGNPR